MLRIEAGRRFPVPVRDGFDYITDPRNWLAYWPRAREQAGLPAARHQRHFEDRDGEFAYRIVVEYDPRPGWRGLVDRSIIRRATERAVRETVANLDERLRRTRPDSAPPRV